jgi:hypothetical protein
VYVRGAVCAARCFWRTSWARRISVELAWGQLPEELPTPLADGETPS